MTRLRRRLQQAQADDGGSALILALLVVLMVGSMLGFVLDATGNGLTLAPNQRDARNESNYLQGAVAGAVNQIRDSSEAGRTDTSCPDFVPPVPSGVTGVTGHTFRVQCTGLAETSGGSVDAPRFAIQALAQSSSEGIRQVAGNSQLYIDGGIYSTGVLGVSGGGSGNNMRVNGTATAEGACLGGSLVTTTDFKGPLCNAAHSAAGNDPAYAGLTSLTSLIGSISSLDTGADPVPTCVSGIVTFSPGYYATRPDLLASRLASSCSSAVYHFLPGQYYMDWESPNNLWDISNKVVGGTFVSGWSGSLGGACDPTAPGVQWAMGGDSRIHTSSSSGPNASGLELCGPSASEAASFPGSPQRIAMYGMSSNNALPTPPTAQTVTLAAQSAPVSNPSTAFLLPALARTLDGASDTALALAEKSVTTLTYGGFDSTPSIPKGSSVSSIVLRIKEVPTKGAATVTISSPRLATPITAALADPCPATGCSVTLTGLLGNDDPWRALRGLSVVYTYTADPDPKKGPPDVHTAAVDGIGVDVTYTAPALRALTCTTGCLFFQSNNNPNVFFHGTVYTPSSLWSVRIHNSGETIFDRGVIVRDIAIDMNSSSKQTSSPFQLPSATPLGRYVLFRGSVDGTSNVKVIACVHYVDRAPLPTGGTSAYAGWSLSVPEWLVLRNARNQTETCP